MDKALDFLKKHNIVYSLHSHPAVFTVEESAHLEIDLAGVSCKNLFLCNDKKTRYLLYTLPGDKQVNLREFATKVSEKRLSFASPELLLLKLGVTPGSVSPLGLINNYPSDVDFCIDMDVWNADIVNIHPNINTATVTLLKEYFHALCDLFPNNKIIIP